MFPLIKFVAAALLLPGGWPGPRAQTPPRGELSTVRVEITTPAAQPGGRREPVRPYPAGGRVQLQTLMMNAGPDDLDFTVYDPYFQTRPQLSRDGEAVPYRKAVSDLVERKEANPRLTQVYFYRTLTRGEVTPVELFDLGDWYEPLKPGRYVLSIKYRFEDGKWTPESPGFEFEVIP